MIDDLEVKFRQAFENWFKESGTDFWNECDAPANLAAVAAKIIHQEILPKMKVMVEALGVLEHHALLQHARVVTAALNFEEAINAVRHSTKTKADDPAAGRGDPQGSAGDGGRTSSRPR